jgi:hypothetical protein
MHVSIMGGFGIVNLNKAIHLLILSLRRLIAATRVHLVDSVAIKCGYLEVNATKFYNVSGANRLLLIVREKVFEDLIDRAFFTNDKPHRPL